MSFIIKEGITMTKTTKADKKQQFTRIMCLILAVLMIGSILLAALMSQVF